VEYNDAITKIKKILDLTQFCVLATANRNGIVSACQMCIVNDGLTVYFQTDKSFEKIKNIKENPNVAINLGAFYFKGKSKIIGRPADFPLFVEKLKAKHHETYEHYTNLPNEVLIEVQLTECKIWGVDTKKDIHSQEIIQVINLQEKTIRSISCDKM
jgi:general stress protein 26